MGPQQGQAGVRREAGWGETDAQEPTEPLPRRGGTLWGPSGRSAGRVEESEISPATSSVSRPPRYSSTGPEGVLGCRRTQGVENTGRRRAQERPWGRKAQAGVGAAKETLGVGGWGLGAEKAREEQGRRSRGSTGGARHRGTWCGEGERDGKRDPGSPWF